MTRFLWRRRVEHARARRVEQARPLHTMVLLIALTAPACVDIVGADLKYVEREEKRFSTTARPQVTLATFDGAIEVRPWDRPEVLVVIEKRAINKDGVAAIAVRAEQDGDRITVDVTGPRDTGGFSLF